MSFTAPLRPSPSLRSLFRGGIPSGANSRSAYSHTSTPQSLRARLGSNSTTASSSSSSALAIPFPSARSHSSSNTQGARSIFYAVGLGGAFVLASLTPWRKSASCQAANGSVFQSSTGPGLGNGPGTNDYPEPPKSILSLYELGFGTVAGICSGVFLKKGLRAIAFLLGGAFIFLQYLSSKSYVSVDWNKISRSYDNTFGTRTTAGGSKAPTVQAAWNRLIDFITANFQQRASFLAGFVLGLRLG